MQELKLGNPTSYREAGDILLDRLDLNNVQMSDYNNFIRNILPRYLSQPIITDQFTLTFSNWYLDDSELLSEDICKENGKSRELVIRATARLKVNEMVVGGEIRIPDNSVITFPLNITKIPLLSDTGSFLVKGVNRVMVSHLERSNTLVKFRERNGEKAVAFSTSSRAAFKIRLNKGQAECTLNPGPGSEIIKGGGRNNRMMTISLSALLNSLNIDNADDVREIIGTNPYLHGVEMAPGKKDDYMDTIGRIRLSTSERALLNKKLSFRYRLSGKILDEDVEVEGLKLSKGDKITPEQASYLQEMGVTSVSIKIPGGNINVINNGFLQPERYISEDDIVPIMCKWDTTVEGDELVKEGYYPINKQGLDSIIKEANQNSLELRNQLELHQHLLLGTTIVRQDVIAIINLFSFYLLGLEEEDDKDSLSNKSLINISTIFETLLLARMYGSSTGPRALVRELIDEFKRFEMAGGNTGTELDLGKLDCDENTITNTLIKNPWSKLFQVESNVNPLDEINHKRKVSLMEVEGRGGISSDHSDPRPRSVNPSHMGRLCPIESPEGENIGLVVHLASLARLNENGVIEAPFFKINHDTGKIEYDEAIYMDYGEEMLYTRAIVPRIAERDFAEVKIMKKGIELASYEMEPLYGIVDGKPTLMNLNILERTAKMHFNKHKDADSYELTYGRKDWFMDEIIDCIEGDGHPVKCKWDEIDYITCRGEHILSAVTGNIPFAEYDDGTRLMMGAAMSKQTEPVIGSAPPLIRTDLTTKIGKETSGVIVAPFDCEVKAANSKLVTIASIDGTKVETIALDNSIVTSEKTILTNILKVKPGDVLIKGDVIADTNATEDGLLQIGTNLLVAYIPWRGYNYEDAIVISEKLLREDVLTSYRATEYDFVFNMLEDMTLEEAKDVTSFRNFRKVCDERGIIKVGTYVRRDDELAVKVSKENDKKIMAVKYTGEIDGVVVRVDEVPGRNQGIKKYTIVVATKEKINVGDKLAGRHGNKGVISRIDPIWKMPTLEDGTPVDIILTPLGIPSRMNIGQLLEAQIGLILSEVGITANYDARNKVDVPKIKALTNAWTGDEEGKLQLYDGETGQPLMMKSTVGVTTINKLKHLSYHKIYARGAGRPQDYTLEGHPTEGRKRGGGQRIGEMEYWSFQAHGAGQCLRELQTYKSDDPENRKQWRKHLRGEIPTLDNESNIPRTYRMTVVELMSCGIDLRHLDEENREIDIFEDKKRDGDKKTMSYVNRNSIETRALHEERKLEQEEMKRREQEEMEENIDILESIFEELNPEEDVSLEDIFNMDMSHLDGIEETEYTEKLKTMSDEEKSALFGFDMNNVDDFEEDDEDELGDTVTYGDDRLDTDIIDEISKILVDNDELIEESEDNAELEGDIVDEGDLIVNKDPDTGLEYTDEYYDEFGNMSLSMPEDMMQIDVDSEDYDN